MDASQIVWNTTISVIHECLGEPPRPITMNSSLREDLQADSLDSVELIMALEEKFSVEISEEAARALVTVGDLVRLLEAATTEATGAA